MLCSRNIFFFRLLITLYACMCACGCVFVQIHQRDGQDGDIFSEYNRLSVIYDQLINFIVKQVITINFFFLQLLLLLLLFPNSTLLHIQRHTLTHQVVVYASRKQAKTLLSHSGTSFTVTHVVFVTLLIIIITCVCCLIASACVSV